jgi:tetratricopeptide (TPR) repeat protein
MTVFPPSWQKYSHYMKAIIIKFYSSIKTLFSNAQSIVYRKHRPVQGDTSPCNKRPDKHNDADSLDARKLYHKGWAQENECDDIEGRLRAHDELLTRYGNSTHPEIQLLCARTQYSKTWTLEHLYPDPHDKAAWYDDFLTRYSHSSHVDVQVLCAKALYSKGWILRNECHDPQGNIKTYDELLARYSETRHPELQTLCAKALYDKGWLLESKCGNPQGKITVYDELIQRHGDTDNPEIQVLCAKALYGKGWTLANKFGDPQGRESTYDALLTRYSDSDNNDIQALCARILYHRATKQESNHPEQQAPKEETTKKAGHNTDKPQDLLAAANALYEKGLTHARAGNLSTALDCYHHWLESYSQNPAPIMQKQHTAVLSDIAATLLLLGKREAAITHIQQVLEKVGKLDPQSAHMHFLLWLAETDTTLNDVMTSILVLSRRGKSIHGIHAILQLVNQLPEPQKSQAECFLAFFTEHQNKAQLKNCLANTAPTQ